MRISKNNCGNFRIMFSVKEQHEMRATAGMTLGQDTFALSISKDEQMAIIYKSRSGVLGSGKVNSRDEWSLDFTNSHSPTSDLKPFGIIETEFTLAVDKVLIKIPKEADRKAPRAYTPKAGITRDRSPKVDKYSLGDLINAVNDLKDTVSGLDLTIDGDGYLAASIVQTFGKR